MYLLEQAVGEWSRRVGGRVGVGGGGAAGGGPHNAGAVVSTAAAGFNGAAAFAGGGGGGRGDGPISAAAASRNAAAAPGGGGSKNVALVNARPVVVGAGPLPGVAAVGGGGATTAAAADSAAKTMKQAIGQGLVTKQSATVPAEGLVVLAQISQKKEQLGMGGPWKEGFFRGSVAACNAGVSGAIVSAAAIQPAATSSSSSYDILKTYEQAQYASGEAAPGAARAGAAVGGAAVSVVSGGTRADIQPWDERRQQQQQDLQSAMAEDDEGDQQVLFLQPTAGRNHQQQIRRKQVHGTGTQSPQQSSRKTSSLSQQWQHSSSKEGNGMDLVQYRDLLLMGCVGLMTGDDYLVPGGRPLCSCSGPECSCAAACGADGMGCGTTAVLSHTLRCMHRSVVLDDELACLGKDAMPTSSGSSSGARGGSREVAGRGDRQWMGRRIAVEAGDESGIDSKRSSNAVLRRSPCDAQVRGQPGVPSRIATTVAAAEGSLGARAGGGVQHGVLKGARSHQRGSAGISSAGGGNQRGGILLRLRSKL